MSQAIVGKWGRSLAVRLSGEIVRAARLHDGGRVEVEVNDGAIVIRRVDASVTLENLFRGKTPEQWRAEYAGAYDWGADLGREVVEP